MKKTRDQIKHEYRRSELLATARDQRKRANGVVKRSVTFHKASPGDGDQFATKDATAELGVNTSVMPPSPDQLEVINTYTRSPKTADELVVFPTLSCNTMPDRDDDYFDNETIDGFAALPAPYGPNGKSYMVGHDYTKLPTGRIFDTSTADAMGTHFLTNMVYVPNTEQYKSFIEDIDFGINWAVSVGAMLDKQLCSICGDNQFSFFGMAFCGNGHWKGDFYDPEETETDDWGDIVTIDPRDPKAVKCLGNMHGARDFYELSQVFLGAQFNAQLDAPADKSAALTATARAVNKGVLLSRALPIIGLRSAEAEGLPLQRSDPRVAAALEHGVVTREGDGTLKWTDADGLVWRAAPGEQVVCLGKEATDPEGDGNGTSSTNEQVPADPGAAPGTGEVGADEQGTGPDDDGGGSDEGSADDAVGFDDGDEVSGRSERDLTGEVDDTNGAKGVQTTVSKAQIMAALRRCNAPQSLMDAVSGAKDTTALDAVLRTAVSSVSELNRQVSELAPRAELGSKFISSKRADAIHAFVKSHAGSEHGVDTARFERMLDAFGDDVDQIEFVTEQYVAKLRDKLPATVRRSSAPIDPNAPAEPAHGGPGVQEVTSKGGRLVSRIHG